MKAAQNRRFICFIRSARSAFFVMAGPEREPPDEDDGASCPSPLVRSPPCAPRPPPSDSPKSKLPSDTDLIEKGSLLLAHRAIASPARATTAPAPAAQVQDKSALLNAVPVHETPQRPQTLSLALDPATCPVKHHTARTSSMSPPSTARHLTARTLNPTLSSHRKATVTKTTPPHTPPARRTSPHTTPDKTYSQAAGHRTADAPLRPSIFPYAKHDDQAIDRTPLAPVDRPNGIPDLLTYTDAQRILEQSPETRNHDDSIIRGRARALIDTCVPITRPSSHDFQLPREPVAIATLLFTPGRGRGFKDEAVVRKALATAAAHASVDLPPHLLVCDVIPGYTTAFVAKKHVQVLRQVLSHLLLGV